MKTSHRAVMYPKNPLDKPIVINWDGKKVQKPTQFFIKVARNGLKQQPQIIYKPIAYFYIGNTLMYLKPFNII